MLSFYSHTHLDQNAPTRAVAYIIFFFKKIMEKWWFISQHNLFLARYTKRSASDAATF